MKLMSQKSNASTSDLDSLLDSCRMCPRMGRERNPHFNISWIHFGLSGGSYYRAEAVLDAFAPRNVKKIDFAAMEKKVQCRDGMEIWREVPCLYNLCV